MSIETFDTPDCFLPLNKLELKLRLKIEDNIYRCLSLRKLSSIEKLWLFNEVLSLNPIREDQELNKSKLLKRYGIYRSFFVNNQKSFDNGELKNNGRQEGIRLFYLFYLFCEIKLPYKLYSLARVDDVKRKCVQAMHSNKNLKENELRTLVNDEYELSAIERGNLKVHFDGIDNRTFKSEYFLDINRIIIIYYY
jgi:hypothetical protein